MWSNCPNIRYAVSWFLLHEDSPIYGNILFIVIISITDITNKAITYNVITVLDAMNEATMVILSDCSYQQIYNCSVSFINFILDCYHSYNGFCSYCRFWLYLYQLYPVICWQQTQHNSFKSLRLLIQVN